MISSKRNAHRQPEQHRPNTQLKDGEPNDKKSKVNIVLMFCILRILNKHRLLNFDYRLFFSFI
jgi:hypothetical protein